MVKHTQTTPWLYSSTNCLSVFDHFVGLACKGLRKSSKLCLNLCSRRWFWSTPNLVICLISLGLWQSNIRFGSYKLQNTISKNMWSFARFSQILQFEKREKHPWRNVTFSSKCNIPPWVFSKYFTWYKWY